MMKRLLFLLSLLLSVSGCAHLSPLVQQDPSEALFVQVLEAPAPQRSEALSRLESEHPQSPWTSRARKIEELTSAHDSLNGRIRDLERRNAGHQDKNRQLEREVERLRDDLEKLKQIIIDMENRSTI